MTPRVHESAPTEQDVMAGRFLLTGVARVGDALALGQYGDPTGVGSPQNRSGGS